MKKIIIVLIAVLATVANINAQSLTYPVAIDATNFPDQYFRAWVAGTSVDKNADGYLSQTEAEAVTLIGGISNYDKVTTYQGIEYFSQLTTFNSGTSANKLTNIDFSQNTLLRYVTLRWGYGNANAPSVLDFSNNIALENLEISRNGSITALDLRNCNSLKDLTIVSCPSLSSLNLNGGSLRSLTLDGTKLRTLDLTSATSLSSLTLDDERLTTIDLSANIALSSITLECLKLSDISLPNTTTLTSLTIGRYGGSPCPLTAIELSNLTQLRTLKIYNTHIQSIDLSNNINLQTLALVSNVGLAEIDLTQNVNIYDRLELSRNNLTQLDVSHLTNVRYLDCSHNLLTSLKVPPGLSSLYCNNNHLESIDVSHCQNLKTLDVSLNYIESVTDSIKLPSGSFNQRIIGPQMFTKSSRALKAVGDLRNKIYIPIPSSFANAPFGSSSSLIAYYLTGLTGGDNTDNYFYTVPYFEGNNHYCVSSQATNVHLDILTIFESEGVKYIQFWDAAGDFDRLNRVSDNDNYIIYPGVKWSRRQRYSAYTAPFQINGTTAQIAYITNFDPFFALNLNPLSINENNVYTGTMCLPWAVDIPEDGDIKVYVANGITKASEEEGKLILQEITTGKIPENTPVIVTSTLPGIHFFYLSTETSCSLAKTGTAKNNETSNEFIKYIVPEETYPSNILRGLWKKTESVTPYSILTLGRRTDDGSGKIGFWNYKGNKTGLFRCYVPNELIPSAMMSPKFRGLSFKFPDEEDALTSIDAVPVERATIDARTACYDLQGRRVSHPQRGGVYIINGKKVIF